MIRLLLALLLLATPAVAQTVTVTNAWSRATPAGATTAAAYMTLASPTGDRLLAIATPAAKDAQLHEMTMAGGVMRMREIPGGLDLPAGKPVALAPGGNHLMLSGLAAPLKQGQTLPLDLTFQRAGKVHVDAVVGSIGATKMP